MAIRSSLLRALAVLHDLHPGVTLHQVIAFLYVAESEGKTVRDLTTTAGLTQSTASRSLRACGPRESPWAVAPTLGLIEAYLAEWDGRSHQMFLSKKGRLLRDQLDAIIGQGNQLRPKPDMAVTRTDTAVAAPDGFKIILKGSPYDQVSKE